MQCIWTSLFQLQLRSMLAGDLVRAVAEMKQFGDGETGRRQQLETALKEATSLFKRELAAKNEELAGLHSELGYGIAISSFAIRGCVLQCHVKPRDAPLTSPEASERGELLSGEKLPMGVLQQLVCDESLPVAQQADAADAQPGAGQHGCRRDVQAELATAGVLLPARCLNVWPGDPFQITG